MQDLIEKLPSKSDFINHIKDSLALSDDERKYLFSKARKVGFDDENDYLGFLFEFYSGSMLIKSISEVFPEPSLESIESGDIMLPVSLLGKSIFDESLVQRSEEVAVRAQKLPAKVRERIEQLEGRIYKMWFNLTYSGIKDSKLRRAMALSVKAHLGQSLLIDPGNRHSREMIELIDSLLNPSLASEIKNLVDANYYFPDKARFLEPLHSELVTFDYIEPNENFLLSFKSQVPKVEVRTIWKGRQPELLYLIYHLCGRSTHFKGCGLPQLAWNLFTFERKTTTLASLTAAFHKTYKKFGNLEYRRKKLKAIDEALRNAGLLS